MKKLIIAALVSIYPSLVIAGAPPSHAAQEQPEIKALSKHEIVSYLNGKGLGYAKVAELNSYPGPSHVLEMAKELSLSESQLKQTQHIFNTMKEHASRLGKEYIAKESELELLFSNGTIDEKSLSITLEKIGHIQSKIRHAHLFAHIQQQALLTDEQIRLYNELRGYNKSLSSGHTHAH